jgi:CO/xanthine dehydrogenase Mo-binding subunit
VARGRLVSIQCPRLPAGYFLIRAKDIPGKNSLDEFDIPVLAAETVSYIGEAVALLIGPERRRLEELAAACVVITEAEPPYFKPPRVLEKVDYDPRGVSPAGESAVVVDPAGLAEGEGGASGASGQPVDPAAGQTLPDAASTEAGEGVVSGGAPPEEQAIPPERVLSHRNISLGNPEKAFAEAKTIVEGTYSTDIQEHWYSEPTGAAAEWSIDSSAQSRIIIHTATQWAFQVKRSAAGLLGISPSQVVVEPASIGIHLDGKLIFPSLVACHAALGTFITKRPVKIMLSRYEDARYSPKRSPAEVHIKSALGEGGKLLAQEVSAVCDLGAYGIFTDEILDRVCLGALGLYRQGSVKIDAKAVTSNIPPTGPFMGFGLAQGFFAMERHAGFIAETLGMNPLEWRKENSMTRKKPLAIGVPMQDELYIDKLLDTAAAMGDFHRKWAAYETLRRYRRSKGFKLGDEALRGIGIAAAYQSSGFLYTGADRGIYSVELTLDKNSELEIRSSMVSSSSEYVNIWQRLAAEILSIEPGAVRVISGNTEDSPDSGPSALSRNITTVSRLVELACQAIRKQRFRDPLPITVRRSTRPSKIPGWNKSAEQPSEAPGPPSQIDENAFAHMGFGSAVVEVEIDPIEYSPRIRGIWMGLNGGKIQSQKQAWRSIRYSVMQALGWASREIIGYENGLIPDAQIRGYNIPDPAEVPPIYIDFIWNDTTPSNGIDELAFNCVPAAYAQAVSQAMDQCFTRIPIAARDIWDAAQIRLKHDLDT